jgi:integrase/recombinase XerD
MREPLLSTMRIKAIRIAPPAVQYHASGQPAVLLGFPNHAGSPAETVGERVPLVSVGRGRSPEARPHRTGGRVHLTSLLLVRDPRIGTGSARSGRGRVTRRRPVGGENGHRDSFYGSVDNVDNIRSPANEDATVGAVARPRAPRVRRAQSAGALLERTVPLEGLAPGLRAAVNFARNLETDSRHTKRGYLADLLGFLEWHPRHEQLDWAKVSYADLESYSAALRARGLAKRTRARRLSALSRFYEHLIRTGVVDASPVAAVDRPSVKYRPGDKALSDAQLRRLIVEARREGKLAYALVCLLVSAGLRIDEALQIDIADMREDRDGIPVVHVVRKGGEVASVPIATAAHEAMQRLVGKRRTGPVFRRPSLPRERTVMRRLGKREESHVRLSQQLAGELLARLGERAHLFTGKDAVVEFTPHTLRHTCASIVIDKTGDIRAAQTLLGHSSPATTQLYDRSRRREAAAAAQLVAEVALGQPRSAPG